MSSNATLPSQATPNAGADTQRERHAATAPRIDAADLQTRLRNEFAERPAIEAPAPAEARPKSGVRSILTAPWSSRVVKSAVGLALLVAVGLMPLQRLFQVSSVEAFVNARLVTVRAPIDGIVSSYGPALHAGMQVKAGAPLAAIDNARADSTRLDAIQDRLDDAMAERQAKWATLLKLLDLRVNLHDQLGSFREQRGRRAEAQLQAMDARIRAAEARRDQSLATRDRLVRLAAKGSASKANLEQAEHELAVANASVDEARAERSAQFVELQSLQAGTFLGDDYNDQPRSAQRLDEIDVQAAMLEADITRLDAAMERARAALAREETKLSVETRAELASPATGQIWQLLTAPGERVSAGQPLYSLLDCSQAVVTAVVSEATYNTLSVGMPASFTFREGDIVLPGQIINLSGIAEASSNYAIGELANAADSYRASVAIDTSRLGAGCGIGRTGRVVFDTKAR